MKNCLVFDLDGTLVDTAPDLMMAHNYVMKKYGYEEKPLESIRHLAGRGAAAMLLIAEEITAASSPSSTSMRE